MKKQNVTYHINKTLESFFTLLHSNYKLFVFSSFILMNILMASRTSFDKILREDAYAYLLKGFEITEGDWIPIHSHSIGLSIVISIFLNIFRIDSIFNGMILSRILSILFTGLSIFPFSGIMKKLTDKRSSVIAIVAFVFSPMLTIQSANALSEPLFIFLITSAIYYLADSSKRSSHIVIATALASLSYYVRPNGIFLLCVIMLYIIPLREKKRVRWLLYLAIPFIFFMISFPHMYTRYEAFGSPFDYGINTKGFITTPSNLLTQNIPILPFFDYVREYSVGKYLQNFTFIGLFRTVKECYRTFGQLLFLLFFFGVIMYLFTDNLLSLKVIFIMIFIYLISLVPIFSRLVLTERYVYVLLPFIIIIASRTLVTLLENNPQKNFFAFSFITLILFSFTLDVPIRTIISNRIRIDTPKVHDEWAIWAANNLKGKIAIMEGGDLIAMQLPDTKVSGRGQFDLWSKKSDISVFRPRYYKSSKEAIQHFKQMQISYVMIDTENVNRRYYLKKIYNSELSEHFTLIRSFKSKPTDKWVIKDMKILKIVY